MEFKEFITEQKNTHMTHIEDKVLYGGVDGTRQAIFALRALRDMLGGKSKSKLSTKWDGAPAIFCGIDPSDGEFFVAKKGIFAKNPKVYKSNADIEADIGSGDLQDKMKQALRYLPDLGIKGVIQGDFLYGEGDLGKKTIDGTKYVTFHPNTIIYAIPQDQAQEVLKSKIGIVWHTTYKGKDFESMKASYGVDVSKFKSSKNVWSQDAMLRDVSSATMNEKETNDVNIYLSKSGKLFQKTAGTTLRELERNQELASAIEQYNNTFVRQGKSSRTRKSTSKASSSGSKTSSKRKSTSASPKKVSKPKKTKTNEILKFFNEKTKKV